MWADLSLPWRCALEQTWEAYRAGTTPVGAVMPDGELEDLALARIVAFELKFRLGQSEELRTTRMNPCYRAVTSAVRLGERLWEARILQRTIINGLPAQPVSDAVSLYQQEST